MADHPILIKSSPTGGVVCDPTSEIVHRNDTVTWSNTPEISDWVVVFAPHAPISQTVLKRDPAKGTATGTIKANRPGDRARHKYVVVALKDAKLQADDPELIVEENEL